MKIPSDEEIHAKAKRMCEEGEDCDSFAGFVDGSKWALRKLKPLLSLVEQVREARFLRDKFPCRAPKYVAYEIELDKLRDQLELGE